MWVDEEIEATVEFPSVLRFPRLRAIRFRDELVEFVGLARVVDTSTALLYRTGDGGREYSLRFESTHQRWVLERVDVVTPAHGACQVAAGDEIPQAGTSSYAP